LGIVGQIDNLSIQSNERQINDLSYNKEIRMKKTLLIVALVLAALAAFGVGTVFAQDAQPPYNGGGRGPMMQNGEQGPLHTFMVTEFARKLNLNVNDINTRINAGETMYSIALSAGVTAEEFPAVMTEVRSNALDAAVKANVITQEQADFMKTRGFGQGGGMGNGNCTGTGPNGTGFNSGTGFGPGQGMGQGRGMMGQGGGGRWQNQQVNP
jgi:hypothetical protein